MARKKSTAPRLIKRYAHTRLYDTEDGRYVSVNDLRRLEIEGVRLTVRDVETGQDVTHQVVSGETTH